MKKHHFFESLLLSSSDDLSDFCLVCNRNLNHDITTCLGCKRKRHVECGVEGELIDFNNDPPEYVCHYCVSYIENT